MLLGGLHYVALLSSIITCSSTEIGPSSQLPQLTKLHSDASELQVWLRPAPSLTFQTPEPATRPLLTYSRAREGQ